MTSGKLTRSCLGTILGALFVVTTASVSWIGCGGGDAPATDFGDDTGTTDETSTEAALDTGGSGETSRDDTGSSADDTGTAPAETSTIDSAATDSTLVDSTAADTADTSVAADTADTSVAADTADAPVVPTITISDVTLAEGNTGTTAFTFNLTLSSASTSPVTVSYATADGTATTATGDYIANTGTITFPAGTTTQAVTVLVDGDTRYEANETFTVNLTAPSGATLAKATGTGTITNDDTAPTFSINDVSLLEGNTGTTAYTFTVTLSRTSDVEAKVNYTTADATATAGSDYTTASGTLTFAPGDIAKTVTVNVIGDTTVEGTETFSVNLSTPVDATITRATGTGTILNDDGGGALPNVTINDVTVTEGNTGTTNATFTVTLSAASTSPVTVTYATADGTATAGGAAATGGADYVSNSGTLTFAAGETTKTITIVVNGDTIREPNETYSVNLTGATGANITDPSGVGTITNDDLMPTLSINDVSLFEGNSGTTDFVFTVTLSAASATTINVQYSTADGTATGAPVLVPSGTSDYRSVATAFISFAPGETTKTITITVRGDTMKEPDETFFVNLAMPTGATLAKPSGTGTIRTEAGEAP